MAFETAPENTSFLDGSVAKNATSRAIDLHCEIRMEMN
jgi:hypothetical protein